MCAIIAELLGNDTKRRIEWALFKKARWRSGNAEVCKTSTHGFNSRPGLKILFMSILARGIEKVVEILKFHTTCTESVNKFSSYIHSKVKVNFYFTHSFGSKIQFPSWPQVLSLVEV